MQAIRRSAEGLKMRLSENDSATLQLDLGGDTRELTVTRNEFEQRACAKSAPCPTSSSTQPSGPQRRTRSGPGRL